jgi:hypothetical protein
MKKPQTQAKVISDTEGRQGSWLKKCTILLEFLALGVSGYMAHWFWQAPAMPDF